MKHAYLSKEEIGSAYQLGGITVTEVKELLADLERCAVREALGFRLDIEQKIAKGTV